MTRKSSELQKNVCPVCTKTIEDYDDKFLLGVDIPYDNILLHRDCWNKIRGNLKEWLIEYYANIRKL